MNPILFAARLAGEKVEEMRAQAQRARDGAFPLAVAGLLVVASAFMQCTTIRDAPASGFHGVPWGANQYNATRIIEERTEIRSWISNTATTLWFTANGILDRDSVDVRYEFEKGVMVGVYVWYEDNGGLGSARVSYASTVARLSEIYGQSKNIGPRHLAEWEVHTGSNGSVCWRSKLHSMAGGYRYVISVEIDATCKSW